jgi:hypothetical protein
MVGWSAKDVGAFPNATTAVPAKPLPRNCLRVSILLVVKLGIARAYFEGSVTVPTMPPKHAWATTRAGVKISLSLRNLEHRIPNLEIGFLYHSLTGVSR